MNMTSSDAFSFANAAPAEGVESNSGAGSGMHSSPGDVLIPRKGPGMQLRMQREQVVPLEECNQDPQEVIGHHLLHDLTEFRHLGEHSINSLVQEVPEK